MEKIKYSIFVPKLPFGKITQIMARVYSRNFEKYLGNNPTYEFYNFCSKWPFWSPTFKYWFTPIAILDSEISSFLLPRIPKLQFWARKSPKWWILVIFSCEISRESPYIWLSLFFSKWPIYGNNVKDYFREFTPTFFVWFSSKMAI